MSKKKIDKGKPVPVSAGTDKRARALAELSSMLQRQLPDEAPAIARVFLDLGAEQQDEG